MRKKAKINEKFNENALASGGRAQFIQLRPWTSLGSQTSDEPPAEIQDPPLTACAW